MTETIRKIAEQADMIVNGFAYRRLEDKVYVTNLNRPDKTLVLGLDDAVQSTTMDDIEIQVALKYLKRNRSFLEG